MNIVVFGGSAVQVWDKEYEIAVDLGAALAKSGFKVINGGYFGIMGAVSRGAVKAGGEAIGVISETFTFRDGENPWLTQTIVEKNTMQRLGTMIKMSDGAIALPGKIGTLNEVLMLMTLWKVYETKIPLICWRNPFEKALKGLLEQGLLTKEDLDNVLFEDCVERTIFQLKEKLL